MQSKRIITAILTALLAFGTSGAKQPDLTDINSSYGFGDIQIIKLDWGIKALRIADFNCDSLNDVAVANNKKSRIELLIQKPKPATSQTLLDVLGDDEDINQIINSAHFKHNSIALSQKISSLVCGDLNTDGMPDIAFYGVPRGLYLIMQKAAGKQTDKPGDLNWQITKKIKINDGIMAAGSLVCADLNKDRLNDLALAGRDSIYIILQKEDGRLAEPIKYPTMAQPLAIEIGDLNADNINDLIIVTNDHDKPIHCRFGLETGQFGPQQSFYIDTPFALELGDIDAAEGLEILTIDRKSRRLSCYKLSAGTENDIDWPILFYPLISGKDTANRDIVVEDFDGDCLSDIIISDPAAAEIIFYKQAEGSGLAEPLRFPALADVTELSAADIDNDGKSELSMLTVKEKIIGLCKYNDGRFSFPQPIEINGEPLTAQLADIDSDSSIDCVYISKDANDCRSLRVIYDLAVATKSLPNQQTCSELKLEKLTCNPTGFKIHDVDQDGLEDVLIFVKYELPILVRQTKKRKFKVVDAPGIQASLIKDASVQSTAVANVLGDDKAELLLAQNNFARSLVFAKAKKWTVKDQYNARGRDSRIASVAAFDLDGRGDDASPAILLLDGQKGQLQILKAGSDKTYRFDRELDVGRWNAAADHLKMLFAPLAGSSINNILLFDSEKFALITPPTAMKTAMHLEKILSYETKITDGAYGNLALGDINDNGRADIIMVEHNRNHIEILALDSQTKPHPAMRFKVFEEKSYRQQKHSPTAVEPRELKIADVTGDGKNDLVTIIHDRIIIYPQD